MRNVYLAAFAVWALSASASSAAVLITVDKSTQSMVVELDGRPLYQWPVSTGKGSYDTPSGKFKAFRMERDHFSGVGRRADAAHSIFFTQKGHAIHGSFAVKQLGAPASHGCVRLCAGECQDAVRTGGEGGVLNTTVVLNGVAPSGAPAVARRTLPRPPVDEVAPAYAPRYGQEPAAILRHAAGLRSAGLWPARLPRSVCQLVLPAAPAAVSISPALRAAGLPRPLWPAG